MQPTIIDSLLASATRAGPDLSEAALLQRYPLVAAAVTLLFAAGVVADVYLLLRWAVQRSDRTAWARVPAPAWGLTEVVIGAAILLGVSVSLGLTMAGFSWPSLLTVEMLTRALFLIGLVAFLRRRTNWQQALGVRQHPPTAAATGLLFYLAAIPPLLLSFLLYERLLRFWGVPLRAQPIAELFVSTSSTPTLVLLVVFATLVAPLFEEVAFRGFAYPALKTHLGVWGALLVVSLFFTALHGHLPSAAPLFVLSLMLGLAYEWSGSIWAPITLHAAFNATNLATLLYVRAQSP